jgi:hypothetical protein
MASGTSGSATHVVPGETAGSAARPAFRLSKAHLWVVGLIAVIWFAGSIDVIEPYDFWWNVKSGEIMTQTGHFLATDVLVGTPVREPYYNPQWGSQVLFYWVYAISPYLLLTLRVVIVAATMGLLIRLCAWRANSLRIGVIATLVAYLAAWTNYGIRPQLFAFLPFVGFLYLLERKDVAPRWLPLLVPIMLFWVNVHGSFLLGVGLLGIYGLGTVLEKAGTADGRRWLVSGPALWQGFWLAAAAAASLLNPYLEGIYRYFFIATNDPIARSLNIEWQPPALNTGTGQLFYLQVLIFLISVYISKRRMRPTEILLILVFGFLALTSLRNVIWWGWVTAPIMAANLAYWAEARRQAKEVRRGEQADAAPVPLRNTDLPAMNWVIAILLLGGALLFTPLWREANPFVPATAKAALAEGTPTDAAVFLQSTNPPGPIFNYMEWGGYLGWELYPQYKMFIDGRFEARELQVWYDYLSVSRGRVDWESTLAKYGVRTLVLNKEFHRDLIPFVTQSPNWKKAYEDKQAVVFVK